MSGEYVPKEQRTPAQWQAYLESSRERNRRYYQRKRDGRSSNLLMQNHLKKHGNVPCVSCGIEVVPVCGFCKDGLVSN